MQTQGISILVADDEPSFSEPFSLLLSMAGHRVEVAPDGQQAFERLCSDPAAFDVLITDEQMPQLTGLQLVSALREKDCFYGRIIVVSGSLSAEKEEAFQAMGVCAIFHKPVRSSELLKVIEEPCGCSLR